MSVNYHLYSKSFGGRGDWEMELRRNRGNLENKGTETPEEREGA